ncbi:hypothetical protein [Glutamicibacter sp. V16R2B1]|uniref:hypothetical protein n=1 Tax=Glutamicibacter sp. V16R2B1 TaxID=2036207 RepID=UPI0010FEDBCF|nr:hypothetical protein [Glutamicibacter sp. V16R2B1]TLK47447.1 hypothetical protein FDN03_15810 [Glutamicibacter sp. V16R2B1]
MAHTDTEHHDHTCHAVAYVAAGEDEHGIWVAGALRPDATDEQIRVLRASPLSGDWRSWGGNLELIAALAVNTPGFPVLRQVVAGGVPQALVAAAGLAPLTTAPEIEELRDLLPDLRASAAREQATRDQDVADALGRADGARGRMRTIHAAELRGRVYTER